MMKNPIITVLSAVAIMTLSTACAHNLASENQSTVSQSDINTMNSNSSSSTTFTSNSSGYQRGKVSLNAAKLSQPHILKIETSANQLNGKIIVDGKVVKNLNQKNTTIDLSSYLSVGEHRVEISANYAPAKSPIKVEFNAPNNNITQQTRGNGILNYKLDISVR